VRIKYTSSYTISLLIYTFDKFIIFLYLQVNQLLSLFFVVMVQVVIMAEWFVLNMPIAAVVSSSGNLHCDVPKVHCVEGLYCKISGSIQCLAYSEIHIDPPSPHLPASVYRGGGYTTEYTELQLLLSGVHSVMRVKLVLAGEGGGCTPTPFYYIYPHK
jgi:hypothetical protein